MPLALAWRIRQLSPNSLRDLWPVVEAGGESTPGAVWLDRWRAWLRRAPLRRRAVALVPAGSTLALAGWFAEHRAATDGLSTYLVVRLWWVEPGRPGTVLAACLAALREDAGRGSCPRVKLPTTALATPLSGEVTWEVAGAAGFRPDEEGWWAPSGDPCWQREASGGDDEGCAASPSGSCSLASSPVSLDRRGPQNS